MSTMSYVSDIPTENQPSPVTAGDQARRASAWPWRLESPARPTLATTTSPPAAIWRRPMTPMSRPTSTIIAPKVSGYIAEVLVGDNQPVEAGQLLARIDDRDFKTALNQAHADVAASEAAVRNLDAQIALQQPMIEQGKRRRRRRRSQSEIRPGRTGPLRRPDEVRLRHGPARAADRRGAARKDRAIAARQIRPGRRGTKLDVLTTERAKAVAQLDHARAVERQAALNLSYTQITAPVDGTVGARSLRVGQFVQGGTQLMAVVPLDAVYVVANFKETQLTHVRNGQPVEIEIDSFHRHQLQRPCRQPVAGERPRIRAAAAGQRHRQLHQDRAARAGEDRARRSQPAGPAASGHVGSSRPSTPRPPCRRTRGQQRRPWFASGGTVRPDIIGWTAMRPH